MTHGDDAAGNQWRAPGVVYWRPAHTQMCTLGLNPYERGVLALGRGTERALMLDVRHTRVEP